MQTALRTQASPEAKPDRAFALGGRSLSVAVALALAVFALSWWRHATVRSGTLDLAVFDQAIWKLSQFQAPEVTTIGWNAFADHFSPVLLAFVPFYWVAASPVWLFAAQAVALGAGYLALGPALDAMGVRQPFRIPFSVAYVSSPLLWNAALYDFHPTTLAVPFLIVGVKAALLGQHRRLVVCAAVLVLLRDDLGLAVAALALVGFSDDRDGRRLRLALAAAGIAWMAMGGAIASALGSDRHWTFHYSYVADSPADALLHPLTTLGRALAGMWRGDNFELVLLGYLAPLGFLPVLRPARFGLVLLIALPLLASAGEQFHSPHHHYGAVVLPFLLVAAGTGLDRAPRRPSWWVSPLWLTASALALSLAIGPAVNGNLNKRGFDREDVEAALALVGPDDRVVATDPLGPYLSHRESLWIYPFPLGEAVPAFPLNDRAQEVSPEAVARVDAIVVTPARRAEEVPAAEAFAASPYIAEFGFVRQFGDVTVYRRAAP